ncbi:MAG TPA: type III secretion system inner membrane ring subunit SctD [Steroidobacteraceae bacterium]|nr:type III secretion system inner membrane ring subunit SctD [Steroidobacteraceae bacterium]
MELRVLSGPQAGCRLPLGAGVYRAGANEMCDVVLEGLRENEIAFVVYVGHHSIGLEALSDELRFAGRAVSGLVSLAPGQVFELGPWLFAVDDPQAPWPTDPESLRVRTPADAEPHHGDDGTPALGDLAVDASATAVTTAPDSNKDEHGDEPVAPSTNADATSTLPVPQRRKMPFWVIGLAGTAAFLICGVMVLVLSLAPAQPASAAAVSHPAAEVLAKLAAASNGDVKLEHVGDRMKLIGSVSTRAAKLKLTREARAIEPTVLLQLTADEDLESLARDAVTGFPESGVEIGKADHGRLALTGRVSEAKVRDQIVAAIWDSVPGLTAVDSQVIADDEVLASFNTLLHDAGLTKMIAGELEHGGPARLAVRGVLAEADRAAWSDVRQKLAARFGAALAIAEDLHAPGAVPPSMAPVESDIVAVVRGPMPYALLRDGTKRALSTGAK